MSDLEKIGALAVVFQRHLDYRNKVRGAKRTALRAYTAETGEFYDSYCLEGEDRDEAVDKHTAEQKVADKALRAARAKLANAARKYAECADCGAINNQIVEPYCDGSEPDGDEAVFAENGL